MKMHNINCEKGGRGAITQHITVSPSLPNKRKTTEGLYQCAHLNYTQKSYRTYNKDGLKKGCEQKFFKITCCTVI